MACFQLVPIRLWAIVLPLLLSHWNLRDDNQYAIPLLHRDKLDHLLLEGVLRSLRTQEELAYRDWVKSTELLFLPSQ